MIPDRWRRSNPSLRTKGRRAPPPPRLRSSREKVLGFWTSPESMARDVPAEVGSTKIVPGGSGPVSSLPPRTMVVCMVAERPRRGNTRSAQWWSTLALDRPRRAIRLGRLLARTVQACGLEFTFVIGYMIIIIVVRRGTEESTRREMAPSSIVIVRITF